MQYNIDDILEVLSESTLDNLSITEDYQLFNETSNNDENKTESPKKQSFVNKASLAYMSGLNKSSEAIAKTFIRKPKDDTTEAQEKYQKKLLKAKAAIKVGEIMLSKAVLIGPFDVIATAALVNGIMKSDDPTDKAVVDKLKLLTKKAGAIKQKAGDLINKINGKKVTTDDKNQYDAMTIQGMNIAKEMDATKAKAMKEKSSENKTITESVFINKFDEYLLQEDGTLVDNACDILQLIVEKTDYEKFDIFDVVEHYINMII